MDVGTLEGSKRRLTSLSIWVCCFELRVLGLLQLSDDAGVTSRPGSFEPPSNPPKLQPLDVTFSLQSYKRLWRDLQETRAISSFLKKHSPILWQRLWSKNGDRYNGVGPLINYERPSVSYDRIWTVIDLGLAEKPSVSLNVAIA